jgi:isoleucyl-tRNA synthetase
LTVASLILQLHEKTTYFMFKPFPDDFTYPSLESDVLAYWEKHHIFEQTLKQREGAPAFTFYEGPPTVNGRPGIHHVLARTIKDAVCRYKTMRGFSVRRQAGWDTHGLPIEIAAEKRLGITDKAQIEEIGIDTFNAACRAIVDENIDNPEGWRTVTRRMGYWLDLDSAYITCSNDYVESVWWALKQFFDKGLIYKGFKVVPQSPTLGTPLSSHELSQNYKDVRDPNVYVKVKVVSSPVVGVEGAELLVWTTTPWTLFGNVALAVGPDIDYVLVDVRHELKNGEKEHHRLVLAESRIEVLEGEVSVEGRFKGRDLLGTKYDQILKDVAIDTDSHPKALTVLPGDFVTTEDGSGIVHLAPAFGQDDFEMSKVHDLPMLQPVTPNGRFTEEVKDFAGRSVKTFTYSDHTEEGADRDIVIMMKKAGQIYRASFDYLHSYPHCWRTDNPVIYYARDSWFIVAPAYKKELVQNNKLVQWHPPEIGEGRFGNWLDEVKEWSLSRDRYWGTPLPIWVSEDGDMFAVGSIEELKEGLYESEDGTLVPLAEVDVEIDLHRPFVDRFQEGRNGVQKNQGSDRCVVRFWKHALRATPLSLREPGRVRVGVSS